MMRILSSLLLVILVLVGGFGVYTLAQSSCAKPLGYRLESLDPQFGLTEEAVLTRLSEAEAVWEKATGKDLLVYDSGAELAVNFVFDERQIRTLESKKLTSELAEVEASQRALQKEYETLSETYERRLAAYRRAVREYEEDIRSFNEQVSYWNERGGAPEDEYEELRDREEELKDRRATIDRDYRALQEYARQGGTLAEKEAALIESYNEEVETFQEKYGAARQFDQGLYTGDAITIYQFNEEADLVLAMAHEFGHALAIGHVGDPAALMYPVLEKQNISAIAPTAEDLVALEQACAAKEHFLIRETRKTLQALSKDWP
jgi:hypothetical protein